MDEATKELLSALIEDAEESDGYFCFALVEPYINANRLKELTDKQICQLLVSLVEKKAINSYQLEEQGGRDNWIPIIPTIWNARSMWYRISPIGEAMLNENI